MSVIDKKVEEYRQDAGKAFRNHKIEVRHEAGVYRHYRYSEPGTGNMGFDVCTFPGTLVVAGDIGDLMITREDDMFEWARRAVTPPNLDYISQKVVAGRVWEYDEDVFIESLKQGIADGEESNRPNGLLANARNLLLDVQNRRWNYDSEDIALLAASDTGLFDEEIDCQNWSRNFLGCVFGLRHFFAELKADQLLAEEATA